MKSKISVFQLYHIGRSPRLTATRALYPPLGYPGLFVLSSIYKFNGKVRSSVDVVSALSRSVYKLKIMLFPYMVRKGAIMKFYPR